MFSQAIPLPCDARQGLTLKWIVSFRCEALAFLSVDSAFIGGQHIFSAVR
jgi:hypothetical protein